MLVLFLYRIGKRRGTAGQGDRRKGPLLQRDLPGLREEKSVPFSLSEGIRDLKRIFQNFGVCIIIKEKNLGEDDWHAERFVKEKPQLPWL